MTELTPPGAPVPRGRHAPPLNKEECLVALFEFASRSFAQSLVDASRGSGMDFAARHRAGLRAILEGIDANPALAQAMLVETVGAGRAWRNCAFAR